MLILSQDKELIVNINNKEDISLKEDYYEGRFVGVEIMAKNKIYSTLGLYATKERAKEVLQEIFKVYRLNKMFECSDRIEQAQTLQAILKENMQPFTYEMSKE